MGPDRKRNRYATRGTHVSLPLPIGGTGLALAYRLFARCRKRGHLGAAAIGSAPTVAGRIWPPVLEARRSSRARVRISIAGAALVAGLALGGHAGATTTINEQFNPATIDPGDTSQYTLTIANTSLVALTSADVTVVFPPEITLASPANIVNNCGFSSVSAVPGTPFTLVLAGGTIPAHTVAGDGQCTFQLNLSSVVAGNHIATIPGCAVTPCSYPDPTHSGYSALENGVKVWNTTDANATLSVNALSAPTGNKSFAVIAPATTIVAGDPVRLTITLSNPNPNSTIPLTQLIDSLPAGMLVASPASTNTSCSGPGAANGSVATDSVSNPNTVTLNGGTIGQGGTCTLGVNVVVPSLSATSQTFNNQLAAGAIGNSRGLTSPAFAGSVIVKTPINVTKSFNPNIVPVNQPSVLTIDISNLSATNPLPITTFSDDMTTAGITVATPANASVACIGGGANNGPPNALTATSGTSVISLAGSMAGSVGRCRIMVNVTTALDGQHTNTIQANAVGNPGNYPSPAASANLTGNAQLTVSKSVTVANVAPGQWTQFTVTIDNWSGAAVTGVSFADNLPAVTSGGNTYQMVLNGANPTSSVGCSGGTFSGADGDSALTWIGGTIPGGSGASPGVCTIVFQARLPVATPLNLTFINQIPGSSVSGSGNGPLGSGTVVNPQPSNAVNVLSISSGDVSKSFSPSSIAQGGLSTLTVTVFNRTISPLTVVDLTDTLPPGLTLAANPAATNNCGGSLQAFPGDNKLVLTGGMVAGRPNASQQSSCAFSAKVTATALAGSPYTNTIPANALQTHESVTNPSARSAALTLTSGLSGVKSFTPTSVSPGGQSRVKITATNSDSTQLTNVSINDPLGSGLAVANPANAASNCPGSPTLVANPGANSAQMLGATLAAGGACSFSFDVVTSAPGPWTNTVPIGNISSAEGPSNTAAVTAMLSVASASISINKSFNPVIVTGGTPSVLSIDVTNNSAITMTGAAFTDTFPVGIQVYSVPNASTTCAGGTVSAVPMDGKVSLVGATLAPSSTCHVFVTTTSVRFLNLTNTIPAGAITTAQGYTNASGTSASLSTLQGLSLMKNFDPAFMGAGQTSRLNLTLVSTFDPNAITPINLTGVSFTDALPSGVVLTGSPNPTTTCAGGTVTPNSATQQLTLSTATIPPGSTCTVAVDVTSSTLGAHVNTVPQDSITTDQGVTNQSDASATLEVVNQPTLAKAFSPGQVDIGQNTTLTVTVTNNAGVPLTGLGLADTLPAGIAVFSTPNASTTCAGGAVNAVAGEGMITLSGATVPASGSCTLQAAVVASTATGSPFTNTIGAGAITDDQELTNPSPASANLTVLGPPAVSKSFSPAQIASGGTSTLTITLSNTDASSITLLAALVDALPGNVFVANPPAVVTTCPHALTVNAGDSNITYPNGAQVPAGGCTIAVNVTSAVGGAYTNTIAAGGLHTSAGDNPQPAVANLGVNQPGAPTVSKSFSPVTVNAGAVSQLTIAIANPNASAITTTAPFVDTLPANVSIASPANVGGTCGAGNIATSNAGPSTVTLASGTSIPAGGCTMLVDVTSNIGGGYTNTIASGELSTSAGPNGQDAVADLVVVAPTPPTVLKSLSPNTINIGGLATLTITLGNANASALTLTSAFVDTLPANVTVASPPNVGGTCLSGGTISTGPASITLANDSSVPPGGCTILVDVTSLVPGGPWVNTISAGALTTTVGNNAAPASAGLQVNAPQPPSISKSFAPTPIGTGGTSTLTLALGNGNAGAATLTADLVDTLPANLVVAAPANLNTSGGCSAGKVIATAGGTSITYQSGAIIPANGGCTISVAVTSSTVATYTNTIGVNNLQTSVGSNQVAASAMLQVLAVPTIAKAFNPSTILAAANSMLTLTLGNGNAAPMTLTSDLVDNLPANLTLAPVVSIGGSCNAANVVATALASSFTYKSGATIPAGGCTISVPVSSNVGGVYNNTIAAGALNTNAGNNPAPTTATLTVLGPPSVAKSFNPSAFIVGQASVLTISFGNGNAAAATLTADLVDTVPTGLSVVTSIAPVGTCNLAKVSVSANSVTYQATATIPSGGCTISVSVTSKQAGGYTNTIPAGALVTDAGNNVDPASATVHVSVTASGIPVASPWSLLCCALAVFLIAAYRLRRGAAR